MCPHPHTAPLSHHVRFLLRFKGLMDDYEIDGSKFKTAEFKALNPTGKVPLLVTSDELKIPESDTICRFLIDRHISIPPSFTPETQRQRLLSELIVRTHDIYISPIQGAMYRAPGSIFGQHGTNRVSAIQDICSQLDIIEGYLEQDKLWSTQTAGCFLCGDLVSLADATLFPTLVFTEFMLPQFFGIETSTRFPRLHAYFNYMINPTKCDPAKATFDEMTEALEAWRSSGRWDPIVDEMKAVREKVVF